MYVAVVHLKISFVHGAYTLDGYCKSIHVVQQFLQLWNVNDFFMKFNSKLAAIKWNFLDNIVVFASLRGLFIIKHEGRGHMTICFVVSFVRVYFFCILHKRSPLEILSLLQRFCSWCLPYRFWFFALAKYFST